MTREKTPPGPARSGADLAKASMAPNTRRAYEAALRGFEGSDYLETDAGVAAYLGELYDHGRSAAVAAMVVAALRFRARHQGRDSPVGPEVERALAGFRRMAAERGYGQVAGIRWEQADRVAEMAEQSGALAGLRDAAIIAVASDALLRVSEISALDIDDVDLEEQTVLIRRSKTDQEGAGAVQFLGEPTVARVRAWLLGAGLTQGALFRSLYKGGRLRTGRLGERSIRRIIIRRARDAGVVGRVSGHSLRVGGAQSLATAGAPWSRCNSPDAGPRPSCRGATRRDNSRNWAPWRGSATACESVIRDGHFPSPAPVCSYGAGMTTSRKEMGVPLFPA